MANRKQIQDYIVASLNKVDKTGKNGELYTNLFKDMSNKDFEAFMLTLQQKEAFINIVIPPLSDIERGITVENNLKVGKTLGIKFFQELTFSGDGITSNIKSLVGYGMFRRLRQTTAKSMSVHKDSNSRNNLTNESSNKSKGAKITLPEADILLGHSLKYTMKEFLNSRGGDLGANTAMLSEFNKKGSVSQKIIEPFRTGTGAKKVVDSVFRAMHIDINL